MIDLASFRDDLVRTNIINTPPYAMHDICELFDSTISQVIDEQTITQPLCD